MLLLLLLLQPGVRSPISINVRPLMPAAVIAIMVTEDEVDRIEMDMADGDAFILVIDAGVCI